MAARSLTWDAEQLPDAVLRVAFTGQGGLGSHGNRDGERMREATWESLAQYRPEALVIDLRGFEYRFGDWIGAAPLMALRALGPGRVCVLATGETAAALGSLWEVSKLGQLIPLVGELGQALRYLSAPDERAGG